MGKGVFKLSHTHTPHTHHWPHHLSHPSTHLPPPATVTRPPVYSMASTCHTTAESGSGPKQHEANPRGPMEGEPVGGTSSPRAFPKMSLVEPHHWPHHLSHPRTHTPTSPSDCHCTKALWWLVVQVLWCKCWWCKCRTGGQQMHDIH